MSINQMEEAISNGNLAIRLAFAQRSRPRKVSEEEKRRGSALRELEALKEQEKLQHDFDYLG